MKKDFNLPNLNAPKIKLPNVHDVLGSTLSDINKFDRLMEAEQISREIKQIELLEEIKNNTGSLVNMVDLIRFNADQQTEILSIIADIMMLGTFEDKAEAESKFRKIMNNINQQIEDTDSMIMLSGIAKSAWEYVKTTYFGG